MCAALLGPPPDHSATRSTSDATPSPVYRLVDNTTSRPYTSLVSTVGSIPLAPRFLLERDQLAQVVCQVRFSPILRLRDRNSVIPFQEAVREQYPGYAEQQGVGVIVTPGGVVQQPTQDLQYRFQESPGRFTAILTPDFIALQTADFRGGIDDFAPRIVALASTVAEIYGPAEITRMGLRFINEFRLPSAMPEIDMASAIAAPVLGPIGTPELVGAIDTIQQVFDIKGPENRLIVRHGLQRAGTTVMPLPGETPPTPTTPFYLLDIDAYAETILPFSAAGIDARLRSFNDQIRSLFAWVVNEDYRRTILGQRDLDT